ncbi:MAG: hypothetical protein ALECFALPRED_008406 [Alectoria fallacina]|uniref:Uncharacterized protein n=1 Tax=Alectoria fallacina TaxID=1903189 RepID=A0A8H3J3J5_9LECA|nr:MAG: hypothetical protein ALECFALPRED_008406 [Alectoria fallacina]
MAAKEPGRDSRDFYIDLRVLTDNMKMKVFLELPPSLDDFWMTARKFSKQHEDARFRGAPPLVRATLLSPHGRLGEPDQHGVYGRLGKGVGGFFCAQGYAGVGVHSIHHASRLRVMQFKLLFKRNVLVKKDLFLVMGEGEEDLLKYAVATTFAIQTDRWRLEVDLWRSFVNVDLEFLEGLIREWLV